MSQVFPVRGLGAPVNKLDPSTGLEGPQKTPVFPTRGTRDEYRMPDGANAFGGEIMYGRDGAPLDPDKFKFPLLVGADNEELRAQNQSVGEQTLFGVGRFLGSTATKFLSGTGFLYGLGEALVKSTANLAFGANYTDILADSFNNGWSRLWDNAEEGLKETLPIYHTNKYNEGNLFQQMGTSGFYMDDLVDGAAFLISAALGSKGISAIGQGTGAYGKLARAFSKATTMSRKGIASKGALPPLNKIIQDMDIVTMTVFNSGIEASFEAKDTMNKLMEQGISKEEAAKAAQGTFWWNMGVLMIPNYVTNSLLFGKVNPMAGRIKNIVGAEGRLLSEVKPLTTAQKVGAFAGGSAMSVASEGPWEENIQLAIQDYFQKSAEGKEDRSQMDGIFGNWVKNFTTDEGIKAIGLGSLIGLIPGGVGGVRELKAEKKNEANLHTMLSHTIASVSKDLDSKDVWLRDKDNNIVIDEETNKPVVDPFKLASIFITSHYTSQNAYETMAKAVEGNEMMLDRLEEERVASLAFAHVGSIDGLQTFETEMDLYARQKVESMLNEGQEVDEVEVRKLADKYKERGRLYKTLYDNVQEVFGGLYNFQERIPTEDKKTNALLYSLANKVKDNAILSQYMASVDQMFWLDKARENEMKISKLQSSTAGQIEIGKASIEQLQKLGEAIQEQIKISQGVVKKTLSEKYWKDNYNTEKGKAIAELNKVTDNQPTTAPVETPVETKTEEVKAETGTITTESETVHDEIEARAEEIVSEVDEEEARKARKESAIQELTNPSPGKVTEITGAETKVEKGKTVTTADVFKKATTEETVERYGDRELADMTLSQIFSLPLEGNSIEVVYQGEHGALFIDPETNEIIFKGTESEKEYVVGKTTDEELFSGGVTSLDLGIIPLKHTVYDIQLEEDGVSIIIQGRRYLMDTDNPLYAIQEIEGEIQVTLKDLSGNYITFTSQTLATELAYTLELLNEAREEAFKTYLDELDSDFSVVIDPLHRSKYYVYRMPDGSHEILKPRSPVEVSVKGQKALYINPSKKNFIRVDKTLKNGKPNPKYDRILKAYLEDLNKIIDRVAASHIMMGNRATAQEREDFKKAFRDEVKEFIGNSRSATAEEIINAPGGSEVSSVKAETTTETGKSEVDEATGRTGDNKSTSEGKVDTEVVNETKKPGKKKKSKDEEEIVDEKAEEISKSKKVTPKKKGDTKASEGIEPDDTEEEVSEVEKRELPSSRHISHPSTAVAWKAEENTDLDKFLSDPNLKLEGYTLVASIDKTITDNDWTKAKQSDAYIKQYIDSIFKDRRNLDPYDSLVDVMAIKLTLRDPSGKELPFKGMYLHKSAYAAESTVVVTDAQRKLWEDGDMQGYLASREKMIEEERKASRAERKSIIKDLLAGKEVVITGLQKGAGIISQTKGQNRSMMEVIDSPDKGTMVVADASKILWDGKGNTVPGRGTAGNVLWHTTETANGDWRVVKLNQAKISEEHADILLKAYIQQANSSGGPNTLYEGKEVTGNLTVGEVIDYLVFEGPKTDQKNKDYNPDSYSTHLVPKTLFLDKGILYYGTKKLDLTKKVSKEAAQDFINHVTRNKNYNTPLLTSTKTGVGIGGKLNKSFRIGSIEAKEGDSYQAFLFRNGMVLTDLIKDAATGRIFSKPAFYFDSYKKDKKAPQKEETRKKAAAKEKKKEEKPEPEVITKEEKRKAKATTPATPTIKNNPRFPVLKTSKDYENLPPDVDVFLYMAGISSLSDDDTVGDEKGSYIHVIGKTERDEAGNIVFRVVTENKDYLKIIEDFDGMDVTHDKMYTLSNKLPAYEIRAELPITTEGEHSEVLDTMSDDDIETLNDIDGIPTKDDEAPFHHLYTGNPYDRGDLQKAIKNLRKKLGNKFTIKTEEDLIRVVENTGTLLAFGTFHRDAITLSKKLAKGTEYEEAFHRVTLLYLTPEQQLELYKEARKKYNIPDATNREVNERLAQEYREMEVRGDKIKGPKTIAGKIKQFFTDLFDFIATVFTGRLRISNLDIDNLFRVMSKSSGITGRLWHSRSLEESYKLLERGDVYTHAVKGRELKYIRNTAQLTDVVNHLVFSMVNQSGVYKTKDIGSLKYMIARDALMRRHTWALGKIEEMRAAGNVKMVKHYTNVAGLYKEVIDNFGIFLDLMKSQIEALGIRTLLPEDPEDENDSNGDNFIRYEKAAFELDSKDNAGAAVKLVVATLRATKELDTSTMLNKFVDYDTMMDTLHMELSEMDSYEDMLKFLKTKTSQPYLDLVEKLETDHKEDPFDTLNTQFFHAMRHNRYNYRNVLATTHGGKISIEVADAETQKVTNAQTTVWGQAFMLSDAMEGGKPNDVILNGVVRNFTEISNTIRKEYLNRKDTGKIQSYNDVFKRIIDLFNSVSVPIDREVLNNILDSINEDDRHEALYSLVMNTRMPKVFGPRGTFADLVKEGELKNNKGKKILLENIFRNEQLFTRFIAPAYLEVHGGITTNSILGPEGNPFYLLSENSYLTDLFHAIRSNPDFGINLTKLMGVTGNAHSDILKQLVDPEVRQKLEVVVFSALSMKDSRDRGRAYIDLNDIEDVFVKMGLYEAGLVVLPQLADRKHLYAMKGVKPLKFSMLYNDRLNKLTIPQSVIDRFYYYAVDEYNEIKKAKAEIAKAKKNNTEHLLIENRHYSINKDGSRNYKDAPGLKYHHFVEFNGTDYKLDPKDAKSDALVLTYKAKVADMLYKRIGDAIEHMSELGIVKTNYKGSQLASVVNLLFDDAALKVDAKNFGGDLNLTLQNKIANFMLNSIASTIEAEKIIFMSPSYYKNLDDKIKRYTAIASTGLTGRINMPFDVLPEDRLLHDNDNFNYSILSTQTFDAEKLRKKLHPKFVEQFKKRGFSEEEADRRATLALDQYTKVDPTDGQAYITPDMFRAISIRLGEWNQKKQDAFNLLKITDRELTVKEQRTMDELFMQPLKLGYFGPKVSPNTASPLYFKMSLATLTPRLVKDTQLQDLYDSMTNVDNPVDMVLFDTAVKTGISDTTPYYFVDENGVVDNSIVNTIGVLNMDAQSASFQYLRRQTITEPHNELRDVVKTQFRKIALSNIDDNRVYKFGSYELTGRQLKERNKELMGELSDRGVDEFLMLVGADKETLTSANPEKLDALLRSAARKSSMPDALIDALSVQADGERYEYDAIPDRLWLEAHQISLLSKKTVDLKLPGTALIQMANFGLRHAEKDDSLKIINDEGFMEAKVSIEVFRNAIPEYNNKTYKQRLEYINQMFAGIGYRVPTQGLVSTVPLKIVGFLPETSTSTIVLPSEFTTLTGSDFDIDKLYFIRYNYKIEKGSPVRVKYLTDKNSTIDERFDIYSYEAIEAEAKMDKKAWYIALRDVYGDREELKQTYRELLDATDSTVTDENDIDTTSPEYQIKLGYMRKLVGSQIKTLSEELAAQKKVLEESIEEKRRKWKEDHMIEFLDRPVIKQNTKAALENDLIDTYFMVLLSNDHIIDNYLPLTAGVDSLKKLADEISGLEGTSRDYPSLFTASFIYQGEVRRKYLWGKKGIGPFARANVHHILGQIAGIHLGSYIGVGNTIEVDGHTVTDLSQMYDVDKESILDWLSTLINAHVDIAKDPYIFNLNVNHATYSVGELLIRAGAGKQTFPFLTQPILKEYAIAHSNYRGKLRASSRKPLSMLKQKYTIALNQAMRAEKIAKKVVSTDEVFDEERLKKDIDRKTPHDAAYYARQLQILEKFGELNKFGTFLFQSVEATTVDTKRFGKNLAELRRFTRLVDKVLRDDVIKNMDKVFDMTFVGDYYRNAVLLGQTIFKDTTVMASDAITALHDRIMEEIGMKDDVSKDGLWYINYINNQIFAGLVGRFMVNNMGVDTGKLREMLYGDSSMVSRLTVIKNNRKYADNPLIKILQPSMSFKDGVPDIIITFAATDVKTKWAKDRIIDGWTELLTSTDPAVSNFAKDLVPYSFFTSGFQKRLYSIYHFIPPTYLKEIGFSNYVKDMRNAFNDTTNYAILEDLHDDVFQNTWNEDEIVPFVAYSSLGQIRMSKNKEIWGEKYPMQFSVSRKVKANSDPEALKKLELGYNQFGEVIYKPFVKIQSDKAVRLYKFVGYILDENGDSEPVYVISPKKSYSEVGKVVREFGLKTSAIEDNEYKTWPEGASYAALAYTEDEEGNRDKTIYDFSGFQRIEPQNMKIVEPIAEDTYEDDTDVKADEAGGGEVKEDLGSTETTIRNHRMAYIMKPSENIKGVSTTTIQAIEEGWRTASTRSYKLGEVGDIITFEGRPQQYEITEVEEVTDNKAKDPKWLAKWSQKEGWTVEFFKSVYGGKTVHAGSWQTTFKKVGEVEDNTIMGVPKAKADDIIDKYNKECFGGE